MAEFLLPGVRPGRIACHYRPLEADEPETLRRRLMGSRPAAGQPAGAACASVSCEAYPARNTRPDTAIPRERSMFQADHFAFEVSNMDRAITFYTEALGLELVSRKVCEEEGTEYAFLKLAEGKVELVRLLNKDDGSTFAESRPPHCPHLALRTDSMDQTMLRLEENRVRVIDGPLEIKGVVKWVYFSDPDNNVLEFIQWL